MGNDVTVEIDRSSTGGTFTNHDIISGVVKLTSTSSLSLEYISVKLEGVAQTMLDLPAREAKKHEKRDKWVSEHRKVLYDSTIVFPPENVRGVSQSKSFTLTPGTYTYDFSFRIPLRNSQVANQTVANQFPDRDAVNPSGNGSYRVRTRPRWNRSYLWGGSQFFMVPVLNQVPHADYQLPPSWQPSKYHAKINYFVKVTCKRTSLLKINLRSLDPFTFLPLDLDDHNNSFRAGQRYEEYKEVFFRKGVVFKDRIPEIVAVRVPEKKPSASTPPLPARKSGIMGSFFGSSSAPSSPNLSGKEVSRHNSIATTNVPFAFELRFPHNVSLTPTSAPSFKLYFVSNEDPARYSLAQYGRPEESNGLGVIYLQKLRFELRIHTRVSVTDTRVSVMDMRGVAYEWFDEVLPLCDNSYENLKFDLKNCKRQQSSSTTSSSDIERNAYELEIPRKYYDNFTLPRDLPPTFRTYNIQRSYGLTVVAGFSAEKIANFKSKSEMRNVQYVDVTCPEIRMLGGLKLTSTLHSNTSGTSVGILAERKGSISAASGDRKPSLPKRHSEASEHSKSQDGLEVSRLPTYNDVVRESSYQDDSEHQRARQRYTEGRK